MHTDRDEMIARCKASGMDDEEAHDFVDEQIASIEAEADAIYHRLNDLARNLPPREFRFSLKREIRLH